MTLSPLKSKWATASVFFFVLLVCLMSTGARAQHTLVSDTAQWRVWDQGDNLNSSWTDNDYDDSDWKKAVGEIGWGDGDEDTLISQPPASPSSGYTIYLRTKFYLKKTGSGNTATYSGLNGAAISNLYLAGKRDDGIIVHINGARLTSRNNMPTGVPTYYTSAISNMEAGTETIATLTLTLAEWKAACVDGENTLCIEVHQHTPANNLANAADMSVKLRLLGNGATDVVVREPYVNDITTTSATIRWRTTAASFGRVWYAAGPSALFPSSSPSPTAQTDSTSRADHIVTLNGLSPNTIYSYAIGHFSTAGGASASSTYASQHLTFRTAPSSSSEAVHYLIMGNAGGVSTTNNTPRRALDLYRQIHTSQTLRGIILLGDSAWALGTDAQVTSNFFGPLQYMLPGVPAMVTLGDRDLVTSPAAPALLSSMTLPVVSSQSRYYSFDRGCVHFVCLDSRETNATKRANMLSWLDSDLDVPMADGKWIVAFFHDSPYTKGDQTSEASPAGDNSIWMRQNVLDILESHSTDVVFTSSSHTYERSPLINGARGATTTTVVDANFVDNSHGRDLGNDVGYGPYMKPVTKTAGSGTVYVSLGTSSGFVGSFGIPGTAVLDHPAMLPLNGSTRGLLEPGFATLDASPSFLQFRFWETNGTPFLADSFSILRNSISLVANEHQGGAKLIFSDPPTGTAAKYQIQRSTDGITFSHLAFIPANSTEYVDSTTDFDASSRYFYRYRLVTESGGIIITRSNVWSNTEYVDRRAEPSAPTVYASNTTVTVYWSAAALAGANQIVIQRSADGGAFSDIATVASTPASYIDTPGDTAEYYSYRIKVVWASWDSEPSSSINAERAPALFTPFAGAGLVAFYSPHNVLERSFNGGSFSPVTLYNGYDLDIYQTGTYEYRGTYVPYGKLRRFNASSTSVVITLLKPTPLAVRQWTYPYWNPGPGIAFSFPPGGLQIFDVKMIAARVNSTGTPFYNFYNLLNGAFGPFPYDVAFDVDVQLTYAGWTGPVQTITAPSAAIPAGVFVGTADAGQVSFGLMPGSSGNGITIHTIIFPNGDVLSDMSSGIETPIALGATCGVPPSYTSQTYWFMITLTNAALGATYTEQISASTIPLVPPSVANPGISTSLIANYPVNNISWDYGDCPGITGFKVVRGNDSVQVGTVSYAGQGSYSLEDSNSLSFETSYTYIITAYGPGGESSPIEISVTTDQGPPVNP